MPVQVLMEALRVIELPEERIEAIEPAGSRIVEPGASLRSKEG